jgi:hypothetical protein
MPPVVVSRESWVVSDLLTTGEHLIALLFRLLKQWNIIDL